MIKRERKEKLCSCIEFDDDQILICLRLGIVICLFLYFLDFSLVLDINLENVCQLIGNF